MNKEIIRKIVQTQIQKGASYAEVFIDHKVRKSLSVVNGEKVKYGVDYVKGASIKAIKDNVDYFKSFTLDSTTDLDALSENLIPTKRENNKFVDIKFKDKIDNSNKNDILKYKNLLIQKSKKAFKEELITFTDVMILTVESTKTIFNSIGNFIEEKGTLTRVSMQMQSQSKDKKENESSSHTLARTLDIDEVIKEFDFDKSIKEVANIARNLLTAKKIKSGKYPVVIANGWGGVILHEACGHLLESNCIKYFGGVYKDRLNKKVMSSLLTIYDDGLLEGYAGTSVYDDSGFKKQRNLLVQKGILKNYLIDNASKEEFKKMNNGSDRRQNYRNVSCSRMSNTYIAPGQSTFEEIITSIDKGIYFKNFGGGQVNPINGEFSFGGTEAYMIENGKITDLVKGASLIGVGDQVMSNVVMVGNDLKLGTSGMCGAFSGMIPVVVGQPTIKVSEMSVGGE